MIRHPEYTRRRLERASERLRAPIWPETRTPSTLLVAGPVDRIDFDEAQRLELRPASLGERFGPLWATYWFRVEATVPNHWRGSRVDLLWDSASEATLWLEGRPVQGLNPHHRDAVLVGEAKGGEDVGFQVELACNGLFGRQERPIELHRCELARFDPVAWQLFHDFETLRLLAIDPGLDEAWAGELMSELNRFCNEPDAAILSSLYERRNATTTHEIMAIGHAHLDTAWLWPLAETYRKAIRTFSTQLRYMDEYADYRFACSQAQQYAWIEERAPELWTAIRAKVEAGQFVPVGGTWIEPDCNIPSGESLVRQFLHGQRWFESRFGRRCSEFWNPDVFGYNGQLPQLMRGAGIDRFLTQKLSWNRFNAPEHQTFTWQGIDGSEVLAHFPPADTYNAEASVPELRQSAREFKDHDALGAQPARLRPRRRWRRADADDDRDAPPRTRPARSPPHRKLDPRRVLRSSRRGSTRAPDGRRRAVLRVPPRHLHDAGRTKRGNRRAEIALHDAEFIAGGHGRRRLSARQSLTGSGSCCCSSSSTTFFPGRRSGSSTRTQSATWPRSSPAQTRSGNAATTPLNTLGHARREVTESHSGELMVVAAPALGAGAVVAADDEVVADGLTLENAHLRVVLAADGTVASVVHKESGRETLAAPGNRLELYEDRPVDFDAWDVDPFHLETRRDCAPAESWRVARRRRSAPRSPSSARSASAAAATQVVRLDADSRRVEFHTTIDWHESDSC